MNKYKLIIIVGDDSVTDLVKTVGVTISPSGDQEPTPTPSSVTTLFRTAIPNGDKRFVAELDFSNDAIGFTYDLTGTMKDENEAPVGVPESFNITIEGFLT